MKWFGVKVFCLVVDILLMGEYFHTVDPKGRLILPAKLRDELGESFIITKGLDNCLFIYPKLNGRSLKPN